MAQSPWFQGADSVDDWMQRHKTVVAATTASLISTFAGFPLDSLKSRLQSTRESIGIPRLAAEVIREEGIRGLWRGSPLPLVSIAVVRTISFTIYTNCKYLINGPSPSSTTTTATTQPLDFRSRGDEPFTFNILKSASIFDVGLTSALAGAASGAVVSVGSCPFELVKVRRQLEFQIARERGLVPSRSGSSGGGDGVVHSSVHSEAAMSEEVRKGLAEEEARRLKNGLYKDVVEYKPPGTWEAVKQIKKERGVWGLWTGFKLHAVRDTLGTSLYFMEYDIFRYLLGRTQASVPSEGESKGAPAPSRGGFGSEVQGPLPDWAKGWIPMETVPFLCGSLAGVTSWAAIYPLDAIKTKTQQRMLSGLPARTPLKQLSRLVRGVDPNKPKPLLVGMHRLYRGRAFPTGIGFGVIADMLSVTQIGDLDGTVHVDSWTIVDARGLDVKMDRFQTISNSIDTQIDGLSWDPNPPGRFFL